MSKDSPVFSAASPTCYHDLNFNFKILILLFSLEEEIHIAGHGECAQGFVRKLAIIRGQSGEDDERKLLA